MLHDSVNFSPYCPSCFLSVCLGTCLFSSQNYVLKSQLYLLYSYWPFSLLLNQAQCHIFIWCKGLFLNNHETVRRNFTSGVFHQTLSSLIHQLQSHSPGYASTAVKCHPVCHNDSIYGLSVCLALSSINLLFENKQ